MNTRGSLRQMIMNMADMFEPTGARRLGIYQVIGGKYYNLTDEDKLWEFITIQTDLSNVSFLCLTKRELLSAFSSTQLSLLPEGDIDALPNNN